jgi:hypothetical protein
MCAVVVFSCFEEWEIIIFNYSWQKIIYFECSCEKVSIYLSIVNRLATPGEYICNEGPYLVERTEYKYSGLPSIALKKYTLECYIGCFHGFY